jgi:UTP:GlnB (protein PII) uridylyltransferase
MAFNREEHDNLLSELLTPDLDASRRTEILQSIRDNYTETTTSMEVLAKDKEKLEKDNSALVVANSKLFRSSGIVVEEPPKDDKKEFSQTVTIEQLEGR